MTHRHRTALPYLLAALVALPALAAPPTGEPQSYGDGVTLETTTPIATILADPDAWAGKTVRVEGEVAGVCKAKGCWIELVDPEQQSLRIKVDDDVIVFPQDAIGRRAVAEGEVVVLEMTRERYLDWQRHLAEEQGTAFDETTVGDGPHYLIQIAGTGAEIEAPPS
jgi:hypothetical protein